MFVKLISLILLNPLLHLNLNLIFRCFDEKVSLKFNEQNTNLDVSIQLLISVIKFALYSVVYVTFKNIQIMLWKNSCRTRRIIIKSIVYQKLFSMLFIYITIYATLFHESQVSEAPVWNRYTTYQYPLMSGRNVSPYKRSGISLGRLDRMLMYVMVSQMGHKVK